MKKKKTYLTFTVRAPHVWLCLWGKFVQPHVLWDTPVSLGNCHLLEEVYVVWDSRVFSNIILWNGTIFDTLWSHLCDCLDCLYWELVSILELWFTSEHRQNNEDTRHSLRTQWSTLTHLNLNYNEIGSVSRSQWRTFFSTRIPQVGCWSDGPHSYPQCLRGIRISRRHFGELLGGVPSPVSTTGDDGIKFV